ncbi:hypothetical protein BBBOND_0200420 [Babesia bigemina]|uniref:Uncharacterized protein n=1 Tax=Babesia bigemina TaxID=5866 RepID=A0A061DAZ0_BABBI|nr:hypothetical protein BBBOND_0200420 [Babesia bigemina]CDR94885.1 hypothetical protein BBBOND_0200420 [Babesia bigemina]|eukprot:XP_012767071.1 hypothetical protein BBBOND_0200420 [Babesia bigemina]
MVPVDRERLSVTRAQTSLHKTTKMGYENRGNAAGYLEAHRATYAVAIRLSCCGATTSKTPPKQTQMETYIIKATFLWLSLMLKTFCLLVKCRMGHGVGMPGAGRFAER